MSEEKKSSLLDKKWFGIVLIVLAIILTIVTIQTNFFADLSGFEKPENSESGEEPFRDPTVGYTTGYIPANQLMSGEFNLSRQRGTKSGD